MNRVEKIDDLVAIKNALVSVSDKSGLPELVIGLSNVCPGITLYSTGGTYKLIQETIQKHKLEKSIQLESVSSYTGQPEMQGGLVKTLDFRIYLGLLSETYNPSHADDIQRTQAHEFDLTIVNLYPFAQTIANTENSLEDARANIDIGGPTMLRASAKNYLRVTVMSSPEDYPALLEELEQRSGSTSLGFRFAAAKKTFAHTAEYDTAIAEYLKNTEIPAQLYQLENKGK